MDNRQLFGILGSIILFLGVFAPIVSVPVAGDINYFNNGKGDGAIILVLAGISFVLTLARSFKLLWVTGLGSLGLLAFTFFNFQSKMTETTSQLDRDLAGNPFRGLADITVQSVQIQWGWALLVVGALLLIAAAAVESGGVQSDTERHLRHVEKYISNPVLASEYAESKSMPLDEVDALVRDGKIEAYSYKSKLYVSDV